MPASNRLTETQLDGKAAYLSIRHARDDLLPRVDHYPTDDVMVITGFRVKQ